MKTSLLKFEEAAIKYAESTEVGDYKTGNKCYSTIIKVITYLKEQNEMQELCGLLTHCSVGVRLWAATYLLPIRENEAIQVLERIASETGIHSFTAKNTLNEWRKGNLKL